MYTTDLTDSQWQNIKDNLDFKIWKRRRKYSIRLIINVLHPKIFYNYLIIRYLNFNPSDHRFNIFST
jgi:hypothetical protein